MALVDCIEFTPRLRHVDPLSDLAFLSMDLTAHGRADLAASLERRYLERAPDADAAALLPLYRAYRAHVRADVDAETSVRDEVGEGMRRDRALGARAHLALAWTLAREGRTPPVVLMRGTSGSGKSTLATVLAPWLGAEVVRSDVVRKGLLGLGPTERPTGPQRDAAYAPAVSALTYRTVLEKAALAVRDGRAAILDATYLRLEGRHDARELAGALGAPFAIVDMDCPEELARARLLRRAQRDDDASDADWAIHEAQRLEAQALTPSEREVAVVAGPDDAPEEVAMRLLDVWERAGLCRADLASASG
jgi:predicted kinase